MVNGFPIAPLIANARVVEPVSASETETTRKGLFGMKKQYQKPSITELGLLRSITKMALPTPHRR